MLEKSNRILSALVCDSINNCENSTHLKTEQKKMQKRKTAQIPCPCVFFIFMCLESGDSS